MYAEKPTTILVLPPINSTTAADAKEYYSTTIAEPLALAGFYVIPMAITGEIMKSQGIYDTELLVNQPLNRFGEFFGADAVLFTKINKWNKSYAVLAANLTVSVEARLISTKTNAVLWEYAGTIVADLTAQSNTGNPMVDLVTKALVTSLNAAAADYVPYARLANIQMLTGIPFGKYNTRAGQDGPDKIVELSKGKAGK